LKPDTYYNVSVRIRNIYSTGQWSNVISPRTKSYHCVANINGTLKICDGNCETTKPFSVCPMPVLIGTVYTKDGNPVNSGLGGIIKPGQCLLYQTGAVKNATEAHPGVAY